MDGARAARRRRGGSLTPRAMRLVYAAAVPVLVFSVAWYHATTIARPAYGVASTSRFPWTVAYALLLLASSYGIGLPDAIGNRRRAAVAGVAAVLVSATGISLAQLVLGQALLPRAVVLGSGVLVVLFASLCAGLLLDARDKSTTADRVLVVGDWADAAGLSYELEHSAERPARVIDVLTPHDATATAGGVRPLLEIVSAGDVDVVVLDRAAQLDRTIVEQVASLHESGVRVRTLSLFYEEWLGKLPISELERVSLMFDIGELHRIRYGRLKRVADVAFGVTGTVALVAVLPVVAIGNALANRGPLFFRQQRVGKNGRVFDILKFRTMRVAPDVRRSGGAGEWTAQQDPRVTPFGAWLRRTHVDELPQVLNILRGDLSTVGPRPEQPQYVDELTEKLPFYRLRHLVRPGLTGWAQVKYGYASNESDALEKLQYEFYYLRHQRLSLDLRIVVRTVRAVVRGGGR